MKLCAKFQWANCPVQVLHIPEEAGFEEEVQEPFLKIDRDGEVDQD